MIILSAVIGILVLIAIIIGYVAGAIVGDGNAEYASKREEARVQERLAPVSKVALIGELATAPAAAVEAAPVAMSGDQVYASSCAACHAAGVLNAPKTGDTAVWKERFDAQGMDSLVANAINGIRQMPARGGNTKLSDDNVREALAHMLTESGISQ